jgi:hypothetical protein
LENQNQSTNRITSKPEPQPDNFVSIDVDKIDLRTARKIASAIKQASKSNSDLIIKQKVKRCAKSIAKLSRLSILFWLKCLHGKAFKDF